MSKGTPEEWASIVWEKTKLIAAVISFLLLDLGFVVVWGLVLLGFHWIIGKIDPTRSFSLLKVIEYISEISTLSVVGFSIIIDTKKAIVRIRQEDKKVSARQKRLLGKESEDESGE
ncbi:MAG TPA: hypothetical protein VN687_02185 [Blastocatellia bacterium]|nr:hypothetical protein [Blastocatellia bacterium]